jgi:hypothetical protein
MTDKEYADFLGTPTSAIASGSDLTTLTARQTLGVFLQGRAGYWAEHGNRRHALSDIELAAKCFPQNADIRLFTLILKDPRWSPPPISEETAMLKPRVPQISSQYADEVNRTTREALSRSTAPR